MSICPSNALVPVRRLLLLWGVLFAVFPARVWGQQPTASGPVLPQSVVPAPSPLSVEYWIASSRECCQRRTYCPQGTLRYFAADGANRLTDLPEAVFLASLNVEVPVCFVIHGDMTAFEDVHRAAPRIVKWIRQGAGNAPVQIVFYTWPSDDETAPVPELDITARGERAEFNGCYLAALISKFPPEARVSIFGHSFGARVASATLHLLAGGQVPGCGFRLNPAAPRGYRAVLVAAAMDRHWLNPGQRYGQALCATEWLLNIHNGADFVINLYPMRTLFGRQALGRFGFSPGDRLRMGTLAGRVSDWDATMTIGPGHAWANYYQRPEIAQIMAPVLVFTDRPFPAQRPAPIIAPLSKSQPIFRDSTQTTKFSPSRPGS